MLPILLTEIVHSTAVVYDVSSYARPEDAVDAVMANSSAQLEALARKFGKSKLYWALVVALVEVHQHRKEPVASFGNGIVNEYGRKLFGGEVSAGILHKKEGWTIWEPWEPRSGDYLHKELWEDGRWWFLAPLGTSRRVLTRLRVRSSALPP